MKLKNLPLVLLALAASIPTLAAPGDNPITVTTNSGRTYQSCRVLQTDPDGVIFSHQAGIAKVLYGELPESLRSKLGYDKGRADAYAKEQEEKKRKKQEARVELQKEIIKANAAASYAEAQRMQYAQGVYGAAGGGWAYSSWPGDYWGWNYGWNNNLWAAGGLNALWNGNLWGRPDICGIPGGTTLPRVGCRSPSLNVYSINHGFRGIGGVNCLPGAIPAARGFSVPAMRVATPSIAGGFHGGGALR